MATVFQKRRRPAKKPPVERKPSPWDLGFRIPTSAFTLAGFRAWAASDEFPEQIRAAFINEEIFIESRLEELQTHVSVKGEIIRVLANLNRKADLGTFYGSGARFSNVAASLSSTPDASFFTAKSFRSGRIRLVPKEGTKDRYHEVEGTPDWVLEVISDSSVQKDTERLRQAYHRAGISEYWLIDARGEEIDFRILYYSETEYTEASVRRGWQRSRVFDRSFRLSRRGDEFGLWEYTLHVGAKK